jgi:hypothetical protein
MIASMDTTGGGGNRYNTCDTTACDCDFCTYSYHYYYYIEPGVSPSWSDIKEAARLANLEACRWILKHLVNWALPLEPILKKNRKNYKRLYHNRYILTFNLITLLILIFIMGGL